MSLVGAIRFHDYQFQVQVPAGYWKWTTRVDVSQSAPTYQVRDIISPYGLLRDSIPLPGCVVRAMADSIVELQTSFAPVLGISPTSLTFTVTEGLGWSAALSVSVTNTGVYGSLLDSKLTTSASFLKVCPLEVGNLASNEAGSFEVSTNSTDLLAAESPYSATVTLQDAQATNSPLTLPVTINVLPKAVIARSPSTLTFSVVRPVDGNYPDVTPQTFQIQNVGPSGSSLDYLVQKLSGLSDWIVGFTPAYGVVEAGASQDISVMVAPTQNMLWGTYQETLRISGYSANLQLDVLIQLVIT